MQTRNLIQSQANIVRITSLVKGNVVKLIDDSYSDIKVKYAIVVDLFNSGDKTFVELLEYTKGWREIKAEIKVYGGDKEINLFPADIDEVKVYFADAEKQIENEIKTHKDEIARLEVTLGKAREFINGEIAKDLTKVNFEEIPAPQQA